MIQATERQAVEPSQAASLHLNIHTAEGPEVISLVFDTLEAKADWEDQLLKAKELLERQEEEEENNKVTSVDLSSHVRNINFIL
jgi:hypothetical protein